MIHMATLVHDDVLDDADTRRGGRTVNGLQGNEAAVILGDYLFSAAYRLCATLESQTPALLIGQTGMMLCAGELLQLAHRGDLSLDQPTYYEIVGRKTASLIAVSCRLGALTTLERAGLGADGVSDVEVAEREAIADSFADFGRLLGIAFQIQDDLLDLLGNQATVGKPLGRDAELGKLTLPIIHHLGAASPEQRGRTLLLLDSTGSEAQRSGSGGPNGAGAKERLVAALEATGSIDHAREAARELVTDAKRALGGGRLPDTPAKRFLLTMADAVVNRAF
jgi:octaprenyl-diphosphate synthase